MIGCFEKLTTWSNTDVRSINISPTPRSPIKFIRKHPVHPLIVTGGEVVAYGVRVCIYSIEIVLSKVIPEDLEI